jgi:hypothetical protein
MKHPHLLLALLVALSATVANAQELSTRTVTIFKNNRSLVERTATINAPQGRYVHNKLPDALFGTFWISTPEGQLRSVFTALDSIEQPKLIADNHEFYDQIVGQPVRVFLIFGPDGRQGNVMDGKFEKIFATGTSYADALLAFRSTDGKLSMFKASAVSNLEFVKTPVLNPKLTKTPQKRLEVTFDAPRTDQKLSLAYLTSNIGWTPVYRLELNGKDKGRLALRAEVVNDAEDLGTPELRLAVGIPNFAAATKPSALVSFNKEYLQNTDREDRNYRLGNSFQTQAYAMDYGDLADEPTTEEAAPEGNQIEDFYFYTIRPGAFPKNSRYQYPVFDTEVTPTHYYECVLEMGGPNQYYAYRNNQRGQSPVKYLPVAHYAEFQNKTKFPFTTGVVNLLSATQNTEYQPISQDILPYTAPGAKCKVKIAETPEIKVTHNEGDIKREENVLDYFNLNYDRITIEGQLCVVNYKTEPVTLKVKRTLEGKPVSSTDLEWKQRQEAATLRVNSEYVVEWELTLKPGEERKWKYQYQVLVDL